MTPLEIDVLSRRGEPSRIRKIRSPLSWAFDTSIINGHVRARGAFERNHMVVLTVMRGADATICGVPLQEGVSLTIPEGEEITASIRPGVIYSATVLPVAVWTEIVELETGRPDDAVLSVTRSIRQPPAQAERMAGQLAATLRHFDAAGPLGFAQEMPMPFVDYLGAVASALGDTGNDDRHLDRSLRTRLRQAWLAEDFIRANLQEPISIAGICRAVGVSRRQLEYAFNTTFGVGPSEFVRVARLNRIRRQLRTARAASRSVTQVALDTGVTHLGRFAEAYRHLFGETPIQTLRNR
jgi:AraC-like DNA-binding protein